MAAESRRRIKLLFYTVGYTRTASLFSNANETLPSRYDRYFERYPSVCGGSKKFRIVFIMRRERIHEPCCRLDNVSLCSPCLERLECLVNKVGAENKKNYNHRTLSAFERDAQFFIDWHYVIYFERTTYSENVMAK